jgi:hypothetical protein
MTGRGDCKDHGDRGYCRNRQQQSSDQKEKMPLRRPDDSKKWCEIHSTSGHDLKSSKLF